MEGPNDSAISTALLPPRLPALGHIKLGGKKKGQKHPVKFDSFVITRRDRGPDEMFVRDEEIHRRLGTEKPMELDVRLPFETPAQNFYAQMVHYAGKTRAFQCDGEVGLDFGTGLSMVCRRRAGQQCQCKPYGRLSVILEAAPTFGGVHVFRTTSWESVNGIQSTLRMFHLQFGSLRGLPLKLACYPAEVRFRGSDGQEGVGTALKVGLVLRASYDEASQVALQFHRQNHLARQEILQLAAGTMEELDAMDRADAGHLQEEFFPVAGGGRAIPARAASLDKLGALNRALVDEGGDGAPDPAEELARRLGKLLDQAKERGGLREGTLLRMEEALQGRDPGTMRTATDYLESLFRQADGGEDL